MIISRNGARIETKTAIDEIVGILGNSQSASTFVLVPDIDGAGTLDPTGWNINLATDPAYTEGEEIYLTVDGFRTKNIISAVGTGGVYKLQKQVLNFTSNTISSATRIMKRYDLNLSEGKYYIKPTNEILMIRDSYNKPFVSWSDLVSDMPDISNLEEWEWEKLNENALNDVYSDLEPHKNVYDIVWANAIYTLTKAKILAKLQNRYRVEGQDFYTRYKDELNKFSVLYTKTETETGQLESDQAKLIVRGRFSL